MSEPSVAIHGAAQTVTGSCYEAAFGAHRVLVDCGLFQGSRTLERLNLEPFAFDPAALDAVVLTHAHLDHSGLLPRLAANGFSGRIWCTPSTRDLLEVMLPDAAHIQEQDAERRNRRSDRADEPPIAPLYTRTDADRILTQVRPVALDSAFEPAPGFSARLWNAGHILGSASVALGVGGVEMLFSGDLGPGHKAFEPDPQGPAGVDHVFCESTYGDRERPRMTIEQRRSTLAAEVRAALERGGNLVVPVFALERTQELLLDLAVLMDTQAIRRTAVFIDSPLASRATEVFQRHSAELEDIEGHDVFRNPAFHFVETVEESMRLNSISGAIILSASGMCEAGRIRHHLRFNLARPDSTVLFVGFQAQGTLGRTILEGANRVRISGRDIAVRASIRRIDSYSAHADGDELKAWVRARMPIRGSLFLTHGEASSIQALATALDREANVVVPEIGERYGLPAGAPAHRLAAGRREVRQALGSDWQNDYADFAAHLKRQLQSIRSADRRREAIARMRGVIEDYSAERR